MKSLLFAILAFSTTSLLFAYEVKVITNKASTSQAGNQDQKQIEQVLRNYEKALKTADAESCTKLYTTDGVFIPSGGPTATGSVQIMGSYEYVFSLITPDIQFKNIKIEVIGNNAIVTSTSEGTSKVAATGENVPEINREFYIFKKEAGTWKIAKYMFNKMG